ncbi:MAG: ribosomal protein S18-alanine N-acetyltransferase [Actinomycetaceae bacterium]|nr:ribosomal protein S18-alanine N-acetyltransferase [Actinomycetaceae bacterium]MDU0970642.1 ribosomal protein S18-alanine N-acetyltransferase [Actinomycetaceae bacterium]
MTIAEAVPSDAAALAAFDARVFGPEGWGERAFADAIASDAESVWILRDAADQIVGVVCLTILGDQADLASLAVAPDHRRAGVGRHLLDHALDAARAAGVREVFLEVRASNDAARALYTQRGFTVIDVRRRYYRLPTEDALVMRARLTPAVGPVGAEACDPPGRP